MQRKGLFGGAIQAHVPDNYLDVSYSTGPPAGLLPAAACSQMRQVPDNQEVWVHSEDDTSLVVELVSIPEDEGDRAGFAQYCTVR